MAACTARANDLMALSRERIADELMKLLSLPDPTATVALMIDRGILRPVLPEIDTSDRMLKLIAAEAQAGFPPDPLRRLSALLPPEPEAAESIAVRLRLSNKARKRLALAADSDLSDNPRSLAYWIGVESAQDRLLLAGKPEEAAAINDWPLPRLPITGGKLIKRGVPQGPLVAKTLKTIEQQWVAAGFPGGDHFERIVGAAVAGA
jgi:poly(A) polymerase